MAAPMAITMTTEVSMTEESPMQSSIERPESFNFAIDVIDHWANRDADLKAMHWVSGDESYAQILSFGYFSKQSQRISVLFERLGVREGETLIMMAPRIPAWYVSNCLITSHD